MRTIVLTSSVVMLLLLVSATITADVPAEINFQGTLSDNIGNPIANTTTSVLFTIYDAASGGNSKWTETRSVMTDSEGRFVVQLGTISPIEDSVFRESDRWLGIKVGADPELVPRVKLVSVGYSYRVSSIDGARGGTVSGDVWINTANLLLNHTTNASSGNILKGGNVFLHDYGTNNTFVGRNAANFTMAGQNNSAFGYESFQNNVDGNYNTASGAQALKSNTSGNSNTAIGRAAMLLNTSGELNTAIGDFALLSNTTADSNTAVGVLALASNSTGQRNTAVGRGALGTNNSMDGTAVGANAMLNNSTGFANTGVGSSAVFGNTTGERNTAIGYHALYNTGTGNGNTAIGAFADIASGGFTNSTAIGSGAQVTTSNKIRLGNNSVTVIEGQVAFTFTSDKNQKENFQPVNRSEVLDKIREMEISSWNYIGHDPKTQRHYGPTAQDFHAAFGHDGMGTVGNETTINSGDMAGVLMIAIKALGDENSELKANNSDLKARLEAVESQLAMLVDRKLSEK